MDNQKQSILDRIKQANNILVTVSANPSVDQLAACIGLTIMLNNIDKRATAVFSGVVPSTLEFLQPDETIEKNTDSLRDFIISLDKSKADKLRYKVEDTVVKIFITPYRTSISDKDLEFGQGDFNVDVVVALGVQDQKDLDQAILAHGRILHDATVISVNTQNQSNLGTLNWQDPKASSLSEMVAGLTQGFGVNLDEQIATALLTGVVAETERFSNNKTSPQTMQVSAQLMAAGANQQLVATKLQAPPQVSAARERSKPEEGLAEPLPATSSSDGTLSIAHAKDEPRPAEAPEETGAKVEEAHHEEPAPAPEEKPTGEPEAQVSLPPVEPTREQTPPPPGEAPVKQEAPEPIHIGVPMPEAHVENGERDFLAGQGPNGSSGAPAPEADEQPSGAPPQTPSFVLSPPTFDGTLTANSQPEGLDPSVDPLSQGAVGLPPILTHNNSAAAPSEDSARAAVNIAANGGASTGLPMPNAGFGAQPMTEPQPGTPPVPAPMTEPMTTLAEPLVNEPAPAAASPSARPMDMPLPPAPTGPIAPPIEPLTSPTTPVSAPPPVPPPFMPQPIAPNGQ